MKYVYRESVDGLPGMIMLQDGGDRIGRLSTSYSCLICLQISFFVFLITEQNRIIQLKNRETTLTLKHNLERMLNTTVFVIGGEGIHAFEYMIDDEFRTELSLNSESPENVGRRLELKTGL